MKKNIITILALIGIISFSGTAYAARVASVIFSFNSSLINTTAPTSGIAKLVAGKAVITTTQFTGTSTTPVFMSKEDCSSQASCAVIYVGSSTANYGFTASSTSVTDTSWVFWGIITN